MQDTGALTFLVTQKSKWSCGVVLFPWQPCDRDPHHTFFIVRVGWMVSVFGLQPWDHGFKSRMSLAYQKRSYAGYGYGCLGSLSSKWVPGYRHRDSHCTWIGRGVCSAGSQQVMDGTGLPGVITKARKALYKNYILCFPAGYEWRGEEGPGEAGEGMLGHAEYNTTDQCSQHEGHGKVRNVSLSLVSQRH